MSEANQIFHRIAYSGGRGAGRTYAMAEMCREKDFTLVCHNRNFALQLQEQFPGLKTLVLTSADQLSGRGDVLIPDHFYLEELWAQRERRIRELEEQLRLTRGGA